jgi:cell division protein FtsB
MKNIIYTLLLTSFVFFSCDDKYKDEYNQIKKDIEKEKAEAEKLKNEQQTLEAEQIELAKKSQIARIENITTWYFKNFVIQNSYGVDLEEVSTKNIFDEDNNLVSTNIYYTNLKVIGGDYNDNHYKLSQTLTHSLNDKGLITKSVCTDFTVDWAWKENNEVIFTLNKLDKNEIVELTTNSKSVIKGIKKYDSNKNLINELAYEYNNENSLTKIEYINANNNVLYGYYYKYDTNNNIIEYKLDSKSEGEKIIYEFAYDKENRLSRVYSNEDTNGDEFEKLYSYDNGFTITLIKNGKTTTKRFTNLDMKFMEYSKEETNSGIKEKFYKNRIFEKEIYKSKRDKDNYIITKTLKLENNKAVEYKVVKENISEDNVKTTAYVETYTDLTLKHDAKLNYYTSYYYFQEYIYSKFVQENNSLVLKVKKRRIYKKEGYSWNLKSEADLLN